VSGFTHESGETNDQNDTKEGEDLNFNGMQDSSETDPLDSDTDVDLIPDGFEIWASLDYDNKLDPFNASDISLDYDNDTIANLAEYNYGLQYGHDTDSNMTLNIWDNCDDTDPWCTKWEVEWGLRPYQNDESEDLDGDGLSNIEEWDNPDMGNFTIADSDGDGLNDGYETFNFGISTDPDCDGLKSPWDYDSDDDGVSDGQEVNGYQTTIMWYEGVELKNQDITVYGNDNDGIPDKDEIDPKNSTDYKWYFDALNDEDLTDDEKEEQIQNQFNPFLRENIPPKIDNVGVTTDCPITWVVYFILPVPVVEHCWSQVTVEITDVSDYSVIIKVLDTGNYVAFTGNSNQIFHATIDIDYWGDYLVDYKVNITATDSASNTIYWQDKINGFFGGLLDAIAAIWNAIVGFFQAVFELVMKALSFLKEWILDWLRESIRPVFEDMKASSYCELEDLSDYEEYDEIIDNPDSAEAVISSASPSFKRSVSLGGSSYGSGFVWPLILILPFMIFGIITPNDVKYGTLQQTEREISGTEEEIQETLDLGKRGFGRLLIQVGISLILLSLPFLIPPATPVGVILIIIGILILGFGIYISYVD
jgi:hypothetical protein